MTPGEALVLPRADCYVVIDALRATTTQAVLFDRGLRRLRVVEDLDEARRLRSMSGLLLFGEEGGLRPEGFDYGNSPVEASALDLPGREAVHVTSNGTKALCAVAGRGTVIAGSLVNLSAASRVAAGFERVLLVCAGTGGARKFALEDFAVAAAYVREATRTDPRIALGDGARLGMSVADPAALVEASVHAGVTRSLGFEADVEFACRRDAAPAVPVVVEHGAGFAVLERA